MGNSNGKDKVVLSLGGSLVVPNGGVDVEFLKKFNIFVRKQLKEYPNRQFFIVVGGGRIARRYRDAGRDVLQHDLSSDDLDWLGIHATKLNAHLIRTIFRDLAHQYVIKHYEIIRKVTESVVVAAGWKPGWSTDYCATLICEDYGIDRIINMSNIEAVYEKDPKEFPDAKAIRKITWKDFRKLVGDKWTPGMNAPFDPIAAKHAEELGIATVVLKGGDIKNLENYLEGKEFKGTVIG